jgi:hypothetical protein
LYFDQTYLDRNNDKRFPMVTNEKRDVNLTRKGDIFNFSGFKKRVEVVISS